MTGNDQNKQQQVFSQRTGALTHLHHQWSQASHHFLPWAGWLPVNYRRINISPQCVMSARLLFACYLCSLPGDDVLQVHSAEEKDSGLMLPTSASVWTFGSFTAVTVSQCWVLSFWEGKQPHFHFCPDQTAKSSLFVFKFNSKSNIHSFVLLQPLLISTAVICHLHLQCGVQ